LPRLFIKNIQIDPQVLQKGDEGLMTVTLTNIGTDDALDVQVVATGGKKILTGTLSSLGVVKRDAVEAVLFGVYPDRSLKPGSFSFLITATYRDANGTRYEEARTIDIEVLKEQPLIPTEWLIAAGVAAGVLLVLYIVFKGIPGVSR